MKVQLRKNYQQRGYKKVLDTFLSNYWKGLIGSVMCVDGLLYGLDIVIVSQQMQVGLDSRLCRFRDSCDMIWLSGTIQLCGEGTESTAVTRRIVRNHVKSFFVLNLH